MFLEEFNCGTDHATARKYVSGSEPFALGHYAGNPIFPGVLSLQLMLDLSDALVRQNGLTDPIKLHVKRTQYLDMIRPGDVLDIEADISKRSEKHITVSARVTSAGVPKVRGTFSYEL